MLEKIKLHQKELHKTLDEVLQQLAKANKDVEELNTRRIALIGALESTNVLLKEDELPPVPSDKELPQEEEAK